MTDKPFATPHLQRDLSVKATVEKLAQHFNRMQATYDKSRSKCRDAYVYDSRTSLKESLTQANTLPIEKRGRTAEQIQGRIPKKSLSDIDRQSCWAHSLIIAERKRRGQL